MSADLLKDDDEPELQVCQRDELGGRNHVDVSLMTLRGQGLESLHCRTQSPTLPRDDVEIGLQACQRDEPGEGNSSAYRC